MALIIFALICGVVLLILLLRSISGKPETGLSTEKDGKKYVKS